MDTMLTLLKDVWHLDAPNLLISVTGGAKNFKMKPRLKEMFRRGLINVAKSTGGWIISGGMNEGVMKQVGDAVHDHLVAQGSKAGLVAFGIATWGCVKGKKTLVNEGDSWPAEYKDDVETGTNGKSALNPNHSHFILVDNGTQYIFGGEIDFRAKLEAKISEKYKEDGEWKDGREGGREGGQYVSHSRTSVLCCSVLSDTGLLLV
ncbi:hypothetical protein NP493_967g00037 [Ridgeia piscesae]|uniref:TRPM SLOG domain-containing protein n=1 Tax=Ridgeia piscesae TaxID=27915 RepID=A0AAD9NJA2_RIDPI|nr:hypothetical protein NP493_967g00037 [Ridgeia piscesae]